MSEVQWKADPYPLAPQSRGSKRLWSMAANRTISHSCISPGEYYLLQK